MVTSLQTVRLRPVKKLYDVAAGVPLRLIAKSLTRLVPDGIGFSTRESKAHSRKRISASRCGKSPCRGGYERTEEAP